MMSIPNNKLKLQLLCLCSIIPVNQQFHGFDLFAIFTIFGDIHNIHRTIFSSNIIHRRARRPFKNRGSQQMSTKLAIEKREC